MSLLYYLEVKALIRPFLLTYIVLFSMESMADDHSSMSEEALQVFATRYAAAWSSQNPASLAAFYAEDGVLQVNEGEPAVGRAAIESKARGFMEAFPDMVVRLESVERQVDAAVFRWLWTGTNTGPGGSGRAVRLRGYEEWTFDPEGLIRQSLGHYDEAEYRRQVNGADTTR